MSTNAAARKSVCPMQSEIMVKVTFRNEEWQIPGNITIRKLITDLGLNPQSILAVMDGKLVSNETRLGSEGQIKLISVISGG